MLLLARRPVVGCPPKKRGGRYEGNGSDQGELIDYGSLPLKSAEEPARRRRYYRLFQKVIVRSK
jgi:hypothetical protein